MSVYVCDLWKMGVYVFGEFFLCILPQEGDQQMLCMPIVVNLGKMLSKNIFMFICVQFFRYFGVYIWNNIGQKYAPCNTYSLGMWV